MKVFISHATTDGKLAKRVADVLRESGFQVWDEKSIYPGDNWGAALGEALEEAEAMVVLLTPDSLRSPNVDCDVGYALGKRIFKGRLVPVIAAPPDRVPEENIPWVLKGMRLVELSDPERDPDGLKKIAEILRDAA